VNPQRRFAALIFAAFALAAPAGAQAATLAVPSAKPCYGAFDRLPLAGTGYTPGQPVGVTADGAAVPPDTVADSSGNFTRALTFTSLAQSERLATFTGTDRSNPANAASTQARVSRLTVGIRPRRGNPRRVRRILSRGWTARGTRLYAHVRRGRYRRNLSAGRLKGACRTSSKRVRLFGRRATPGKYKVHFDTYRRFKRTRRQRVTFRVTIFRTFRSSSAAGASTSSLTERWKRVDSAGTEAFGG